MLQAWSAQPHSPGCLASLLLPTPGCLGVTSLRSTEEYRSQQGLLNGPLTNPSISLAALALARLLLLPFLHCLHQLFMTSVNYSRKEKTPALGTLLGAFGGFSLSRLQVGLSLEDFGGLYLTGSCFEVGKGKPSGWAMGKAEGVPFVLVSSSLCLRSANSRSAPASACQV